MPSVQAATRLETRGTDAPVQTHARYSSVDALRGLIMMLMAVDHASAFIARQHASEFWAGAMSAYTSAFPFLTRVITHLCAPGFFFLMGAGVYWSAASSTAPVRRTVWRGVILLVLAQLIEVPLLYLTTLLKAPAVLLNQVSAPLPNDGSSLYWGLLTLSGLGLVLIVCGVLLRLRPWMCLLVSALCVVATNSLLPASGKPGPWWLTVLLAPGLSEHLLVLYPVVPWLAASSAGMYFGYWWRRNPALASGRVWVVGAVLVAAGVGLRLMGGWGNIRPPRDAGWIEFLNNVKYPPSLVFLCLSLGACLLLLALLTRLPAWLNSERSPLVVFGQTPLFFYFAHFVLLAVVAFSFSREPSSLVGAWGIWVVVLVALYPVCAWYRKFKMGKPRESVWRML